MTSALVIAAAIIIAACIIADGAPPASGGGYRPRSGPLAPPPRGNAGDMPRLNR